MSTNYSKTHPCTRIPNNLGIFLSKHPSLHTSMGEIPLSSPPIIKAQPDQWTERLACQQTVVQYPRNYVLCSFVIRDSELRDANCCTTPTEINQRQCLMKRHLIECTSHTQYKTNKINVRL